ncbi:TetR/AcrR family transcriptional regulator [Rhodococcus artemisiae]|uniref:TetR/AcrR family transcriptional regulator n=1 Tax=Rhodococcus artemisiae TaxID=714159 RepID=A0ABU7LA48_9NOCA|nr:TetR/AcrR family transcriptional regulator [Rhodococcus artemisiae]MEE2058405.1 TetR/AcrR family transcriptional regulator [Rhodococcus artemisiae]
MPRVSDAHRVARRAEIIGAALRCFTRAGYQRTSMADIITESGLSAGAIYSYFGGKQQLLVAVADHVLGDRQTALAAGGTFEGARSPGGVAANIMRALAEKLRGIAGDGYAKAILQVWAEATIDPEIRELAHSVIGQLLGAVTDALVACTEADPDVLPAGETDARAWAVGYAPVVLGVVQGFIVQQSLFDDFDVDAYIAAAADTL